MQCHIDGAGRTPERTTSGSTSRVTDIMLNGVEATLAGLPHVEAGGEPVDARTIPATAGKKEWVANEMRLKHTQ
jgi:hypothetical protein